MLSLVNFALNSITMNNMDHWQYIPRGYRYSQFLTNSNLHVSSKTTYHYTKEHYLVKVIFSFVRSYGSWFFGKIEIIVRRFAGTILGFTQKANEEDILIIKPDKHDCQVPSHFLGMELWACLASVALPLHGSLLKYSFAFYFIVFLGS